MRAAGDLAAKWADETERDFKRRNDDAFDGLDALLDAAPDHLL